MTEAPHAPTDEPHPPRDDAASRRFAAAPLTKEAPMTTHAFRPAGAAVRTRAAPRSGRTDSSTRPRGAARAVLAAASVGALLAFSPTLASSEPALRSPSALTSTQDTPSQAGEPFALRSAIVFTSGRDNIPPNPPPIDTPNPLPAGEIYLKMMKDTTWDTTPPLRLTDNTTGEGFAAISPDGRKLVFDSNRDAVGHNEVSQISDLYLMDLGDSDGLTHSVPDAKHAHLTRGSSASWSPDSKWIVFHASRSGIYSPTTTTGLARKDPGAPTFDSDIFVLNVDDCLNHPVECRAKEKAGEPGVLPDFLKNLTRGTSPTLIDEDPDWSPFPVDGQQKIVFTSHDGEVGNYFSPATLIHNNASAEIYMMNADGTGRECLTCGLDAASPAATATATAAASPSPTATATATAASPCPTPVPAHCGEERGPGWSPNGKRILYLCRRSVGGVEVRAFQLCVLDSNGEGATRVWHETQLTTNSLQHLAREWSPNGDYIVFHRGLGGGQIELFGMKADGTGEKRLTCAPADPPYNIFPSWGAVRVRVRAVTPTPTATATATSTPCS
jgi:Tol biopolymer transport system component